MTGLWVALLIFCGIGLGIFVARCLRAECVPYRQPVIVSIESRSHRPSRRPDPVVAKLELTRPEREAIVEAYREAFTDSGVWPDIKLEAFLELVSMTPPSVPVPLYFAQKRIVLEFAQTHRLQWLRMLIERECMRSLNPIPEDVA